MENKPAIQTDNKKDFYNSLAEQVKSMFSQEHNFLANTANFSALVYMSLPEVNWAGFYFRQGNELVLGPFQGKPACVSLPFGKGVCWESVNNRKSVVVKNVHEFPGHIACDSASTSEMVIPIIQNNKLFGVFDIDSPLTARFDDDDRRGLEKMLDIFIKSTDFSPAESFIK